MNPDSVIDHREVNIMIPVIDDALPEGWDYAKLSEFVTLRKGKKPGRLAECRWAGAVPYIDIEAFEAGNIRRYADPSSSNLVEPGEILIVWDGARCGLTGRASVSGALGSTLAAIKPFLIHPDYLLYYLRSCYETINSNHRGSGIPHVDPEIFWNLEVPLPPLVEQQRIVAEIEELLARVNSARERLAKVPTILKRFRQAVLAAACSGRLTEEWRTEQVDIESASELVKRVYKQRPNRFDASDLPEIPEEWTWVRLPDLGKLSRGKSRHRPRNAPHLYGGPYPFIQTGDIAQSGGRIIRHKQTYSQAGLAQSRLWPVGTVCITIAANIADSAILTYPACFPDSVAGLIVEPKLCVAEYAELFIRTARNDLSQFAPATAQKNINIAILSDVGVPLPPLAEQHEIVRRVEALFKLADTIERRVAAATVRAKKLTQAILAKAFRGELVPTEAELARREGRDYEPASVLLGRIQANRFKDIPKSHKQVRHLIRNHVDSFHKDSP